MTRYVLQRLLAAIPVLFLVSLGVFLLIHLTPGDPVVTMLGDRATPETIQELRHALGLEEPLPIQYVNWITQALRGNLGTSIRTPQPVSEAIMQRLVVTLELTVLAMFFSLGVALPLGTLAAIWRGSPIDRLITFYTSLGIAIPSFWLGVMLLLVFSLRLHWLPAAGYVGLNADPIGSLRSMVLPALSLGLALSAEVTRMTRASLVEALDQDYVRTARAKGLAEADILIRHCLRNALIPIVTIIGLQLSRLFGGAVIVESVFALPGLGRLMVDSILTRDFPVVQGVVLVIALAVVLTSLVIDLVYARVDPRIHYG